MRTTSSLEGMNSVLRRMFPLHPGIFKFMERLQYHEFAHQLKFFKLLREDHPMESQQFIRRRRKDQLRDAKIKHCLHELLVSPDFTVGDFLESLANDSVLPGA